jgi:sortase A
MKIINWTQRLLLLFGLFLIAIYGAAYVHKEISSRAQLERFDSLRKQTPVQGTETLVPESRFAVDFRLWSAKRIAEYEDSFAQHVSLPLAVLRISKFQLRVPVLEGTDELTLNRGIGHIAGTARPDEQGNIGLAGHRDGFFRVLKDISPGDTIELQTTRATDHYIVDQIVLVRPDDVSVLQPRSVRSLTLVTCYPFYFIGSAPQRYIVRASITSSDPIGVAGVIERELAHLKASNGPK